MRSPGQAPGQLDPIGSDPAHRGHRPGVVAGPAEQLDDVVDRFAGGRMHRIAGKSGPAPLIEPEGSGSVGLLLILVDPDHLEVGDVVEGQEGVVGPDPGVRTPGDRGDPRAALDVSLGSLS